VLIVTRRQFNETLLYSRMGICGQTMREKTIARVAASRYRDGFSFNARFGSKADKTSFRHDVPLTRESGHSRAKGDVR
jgi:hypothetical protein